MGFSIIWCARSSVRWWKWVAAPGPNRGRVKFLRHKIEGRLRKCGQRLSIGKDFDLRNGAVCGPRGERDRDRHDWAGVPIAIEHIQENHVRRIVRNDRDMDWIRGRLQTLRVRDASGQDMIADHGTCPRSLVEKSPGPRGDHYAVREYLDLRDASIVAGIDVDKHGSGCPELGVVRGYDDDDVGGFINGNRKGRRDSDVPKNSTFAIAPSTSVAVATIEITAPGLNTCPGVGDVRVTPGGWFALTLTVTGGDTVAPPLSSVALAVNA